MKVHLIKFNVILSIFLFTNRVTAKVNPQPGENLWRLTARIGECVDVEGSKLDWIESQK
jgi:hypothetical protein